MRYTSKPLVIFRCSFFIAPVIASMPVFRPFGVDGHVLDLDTAVKDGVLDGGGGGTAMGDCVEKVDLKTMILELGLLEVPPVFICPISLEPMLDPVTLCTGQTYEKENILKWFGFGHSTCPTTMQELWDDSITPNTTLYQLIRSWFSHKYVLMKKRAEDVEGTACDLIYTLKKAKGRARVQALKELCRIVASHSLARKSVADKGGALVVSSLLGPFATHAVASLAIRILSFLPLDSESKSCLLKPAKMSLMVDVLNEGTEGTKIHCISLMQKLLEDKEFRPALVASHGLVVCLMRLVRDKKHNNGVLAGLSMLRSICVFKEVGSLIVNIGAVPQLIDLLPLFGCECLELALFVLDALSSLPGGMLALRNSPNAISNLVKVLVCVSERCTQHALSILRSICKLAPQEYSSIALDAGVAPKLLLVIQSSCDPALKQQSAELLKMCSLYYTDTIFISKCKLTKTMQ